MSNHQLWKINEAARAAAGVRLVHETCAVCHGKRVCAAGVRCVNCAGLGRVLVEKEAE